MRAAGLVLIGVLILHWLRYLLAYGDHAREELHSQGHSYLEAVLPGVVVLALSLAIGSLAARTLAASGGGRGSGRGRRPPLFAGALVTVYSIQELAEGSLSTDHHEGLAALIADGGWVALPIAFLLGSILSLFERLLAPERMMAAGEAVDPRQLPRAPLSCRVPEIAHLRPMPSLGLVFGFARRPPPVAVS